MRTNARLEKIRLGASAQDYISARLMDIGKYAGKMKAESNMAKPMLVGGGR